jgi:hypothetical protein
MRLVPVHDVEQTLAQLRGDTVEIGVPAAPVFEHRELGAQRRRQRAGGEQDGVAVHGVSLSRFVQAFQAAS